MKKMFALLSLVLVSSAALPVLAAVAEDAPAQGSKAWTQDEIDRVLDGIRSDSKVIRDDAIKSLNALPDEALRSIRKELQALAPVLPGLKGALERASDQVKDQVELPTDRPVQRRDRVQEQPLPERRATPESRQSFSQTFSLWENGNTTTFEQGSDGKLTVRVKLKGEAEKVHTYDTPEALKAADADLYALWKRHADAFKFRVKGIEVPAEEPEPTTEEKVEGGLGRFEEVLKQLQDSFPNNLDQLDDKALRDKIEKLQRAVDDVTKEANDLIESTRKLLEEVGKLAPTTPEEGGDPLRDLFDDTNDPFRDFFRNGQDPFEAIRKQLRGMDNLFEKQFEEMGKHPRDLDDLFKKLLEPMDTPKREEPKKDVDEDF